MQQVCPRGRAWLGFWLLVALAALPACKLDVFQLGGGDDTGDDTGDGGTRDGGDGRFDAMLDAIPDAACIAFPEVCNGLDDDCDEDGAIDEDFDFTRDPRHCGGCNRPCFAPNTDGTCVDSECVFECAPGYVDTDGDPSNGCDYLCTVTNNGVEICDLADNDCDQEIDEDLDPPLSEDVDNCGRCGNRCVALHAEAICDGGVCGFGACDPGYADITDAIVGCEYECPVFPAVAEICNGVDDDCDGLRDELPIPGMGGDCADPGFEAQMGVGRCAPGVLSCDGGVERCRNFVRPLANDSLCNGVDDDCDGVIDEDVNFNDPRTCGGCTPCDLPNAIEGCSNGGCTVVACLPGWVDLDGLASTGCEHACTPTGPETCDGIDNDCDGLTDLDDPDLIAPANFCQTLGACAGTSPTCEADACTGAVGWTCDYGSDAETDACGNLVAQELLCDDLDGNCNGQTDERFPQKGTACDDDGVGICRRTGTQVCAPNQTSLTCNLTSPVVTGEPEACNNLDDDCDGEVDEDAPDLMVQVGAGPSAYWVYTYEASRPDATATVGGNASHRACSRLGVRPWRNVTHTQAVLACAAAGKRLCSETEFELACAGSQGLRFPYGNAYDATACNGRDVDLDCTAPDSDEVAVTGRSFRCPTPGPTSSCVSPWGAVDMSGNLREWTSTPVGASSFRVRGGGYDNIEPGLRCDFSFIAFTPDTAFPNLGFRCCADQPDPTP
jgi:hypothetical protein